MKSRAERFTRFASNSTHFGLKGSTHEPIFFERELKQQSYLVTTRDFNGPAPLQYDTAKNAILHLSEPEPSTTLENLSIILRYLTTSLLLLLGMKPFLSNLRYRDRISEASFI